MDKYILIKTRRGPSYSWAPGTWDNYTYRGDVFTVEKEGEWIGIYNMNDTMAIEIVEDPVL